MKLRRDFLAAMVKLAGVGAVGAVGAVAPGLAEGQKAGSKKAAPAPDKAAPKPPAIEQVPAYARTQNYKVRKQSSWNHTGANQDFWTLDPGATKEVFSVEGPGIITHLWFTLLLPRIRRGDPLMSVVLRIYWDGSERPSVEAPLGNFFGMNTAEFFQYQSVFLNVSSRGLNCYFAMPFRKSARITITNEADGRIAEFYSNIDYKLVTELPADAMYFHAQYRQSVPTTAMRLEGGLNLDAKSNYVFLETRGRGSFMGVTMGVIQGSDGWWGEGDDMTFIDDETTPTLNGTGAEDYFNAGFAFGSPFAYLYTGAPYIVDPERINGRWCMYRWHADCPVTFERYFRHTIEHGSGNDRADMYYSVAYWYAAEIATDFPALPPVTQRNTRLIVQAPS